MYFEQITENFIWNLEWFSFYKSTYRTNRQHPFFEVCLKEKKITKPKNSQEAYTDADRIALCAKLRFLYFTVNYSNVFHLPRGFLNEQFLPPTLVEIKYRTTRMPRAVEKKRTFLWSGKKHDAHAQFNLTRAEMRPRRMNPRYIEEN